MGHWPRKNPLNFGADPDKGADPGIFIFHKHCKIGHFFHILINFPGNNAWIKNKCAIFKRLIPIIVYILVESK